MRHELDHGLQHQLRLFLIALQFLTRVPVPAWVGWRDDWMNQSARYFPLVGAVVGAFGAAVFWAAAHLWSATLAVMLSMVATVWLTGAFHEDGLADTCDGLGGAVSRQRALEIMKDSRLGTYGTVGLLAVLALKAVALTGLATRDLAATLVLLPVAHAWSRLAAVALLRALPYAGDPGQAKAKPMAQQIDGTGVGVALVCGLAAAALAAPWWSATLLVAGALAPAATAWLMARWLRRRLGGYTGDTLGATQQLSELAIYLVLLALLSRG
jgi:adenosylcobinamide-GDP ribazoletransferase